MSVAVNSSAVTAQQPQTKQMLNVNSSSQFYEARGEYQRLKSVTAHIPVAFEQGVTSRPGQA